MPAATRKSQELLHALQAAGVTFCHWKSNGHLAEALAGETDLDLLVEEGSAPSFRAIVRKCGAIRILAQPWAAYPQVEDWLVCDEPTGALLHLHTHFILATGLKRVKHLYLPWQALVFANLRSQALLGWPTPKPELELLVLLVRIWAKMPPLKRLFGPRLPASIRVELDWLLSSSDPAEVARLAAALKLPGPALANLANDAGAIAEARKVYRAVRQHRRMSWPSALLSAAALNLQLAITRFRYKRHGLVAYRKRLAGPGALIAVLGSDGSGKSTLTASLMKWLTYKLDAHLLYMGSGDGRAGTLNQLRRSLSGLWKKNKKKLSTGRGQGSGKDKGTSHRLWRLFDLLLLRRKLRLLRRARMLADGGSIILLDRYPQDQVPGISDGMRQQDGAGFSWAAAMERKIHDEIKKLGPDLVVKLELDPAIAQARKPDHDLAAIAAKNDIVRRLVFPRSTVVTIDAAQDATAVLRSAQGAIWLFVQQRQPS